MWKTCLKITISAFILWLLFREVHFDELQPYFKQINLNILIASLSVQLISSVIAGWRWALIMDALKFQAPVNFYVKSYLKGVMFNQVLPTSIGGDVYRMLETAQLGRGKKEAMLGVLVDRIYGLVGLVALSILSLPFAYYLLPKNILNIVVSVSVLAIFGIFILLKLKSVSIPFLNSLIGFFKDLGQRLESSITSWRDCVIKFFLTLLPNFLTVYAFYLLAQSLGVTGSLSDYMVIIPFVLLLTMIPISLAGWGVREGAMVFLGGLIGINKPEALAISLLFGLILILTSIPGLYFYATKKSLTFLRNNQ